MRSHRKAVLKLKTDGLAIVDKRYGAAKHLFEWREDLIRDLGGLESLSAAKLALVEDAARTKLMIDHLDSFIMAQESLVPRSATRAKQRLYPLVFDRLRLAEHQLKVLSQLGLERRKVTKHRSILEALAADAPEQPKADA
jgi:hypothetical protein